METVDLVLECIDGWGDVVDGGLFLDDDCGHILDEGCCCFSFGWDAFSWLFFLETWDMEDAVIDEIADE